jgi:hypothetical protein
LLKKARSFSFRSSHWKLLVFSFIIADSQRRDSFPLEKLRLLGGANLRRGWLLNLPEIDRRDFSKHFSPLAFSLAIQETRNPNVDSELDRMEDTML